MIRVGIGTVLKAQGCRPGDANTGLLCTEPINTKCDPITWDGCKSRFFDMCVGGFVGGECRTTGGGTYSQELKCDPGRENIASLCYEICPEGYYRNAEAPQICKLR
jgi:hypothetical protein